MRATLLFREKQLFHGLIIEMVIWRLPAPDDERPSGLKYSLHCCREDGSLVVRYDNERGKGDHRHYPDREEPYSFTDVNVLVADFLADVRGAL